MRQAGEMKLAGRRISTFEIAESAVLLVAMTACAPSMASLQSETDGQLSAPGSTQVQDGGHGAENSIEGPIPAIVWRRYAIDAKPDAVLSFFDDELASRGWLAGGGSSGIRSTDETTARSWHKDDRILRVGIFRVPPPITGVETNANLTYYEVALIAEKLPGPRPSGNFSPL